MEQARCNPFCWGVIYPRGRPDRCCSSTANVYYSWCIEKFMIGSVTWNFQLSPCSFLLSSYLNLKALKALVNICKSILPSPPFSFGRQVVVQFINECPPLTSLVFHRAKGNYDVICQSFWEPLSVPGTPWMIDWYGWENHFFTNVSLLEVDKIFPFPSQQPGPDLIY